ncbi:MAG TPA: hypothetical protein VF897_03160 [Roseiflexaceae bacterium]
MARRPVETAKALDAFEQYWALGPARSLRTLAEQTGIALSQLGAWSSTFDWRYRVLQRQREEIAASRAAAKKESAALARRRLRNAQLLQEAALTIFAQANIPDMDEVTSRDLLETALKMMDSGMRAERLELGEATETVNLTPPKPIGSMSNEELQEFISLLETA